MPSSYGAEILQMLPDNTNQSINQTINQCSKKAQLNMSKPKPQIKQNLALTEL
jgi:predicted Co/Zn/Cd cation transporter (cation efflux family)